MAKTNRDAFFYNGSWYHRTKYFREDYFVGYSKKEGFNLHRSKGKLQKNAECFINTNPIVCTKPYPRGKTKTTILQIDQLRRLMAVICDTEWLTETM